MSEYRLLLGDCLEQMKTLDLSGVSAVIADPPYGVNYRQGVSPRTDRWPRRHVGTAIHGDDTPFDPSPFLGFPVVILFGANNYADKLPPSRGWIFWDKKPDLGSNDFGDGELIWTNQNRVVRGFRHRWAGVIRDSENGEQSYHPTQKPVALLKWLIEQYTKPGDTIFDPFAGSGSCGVAAIQTGRNYIGCEIDPAHYQTAARRLALAAAQPSLFAEGVL